jgi:reactive intermediate/imine deaminase
VNKVQIRTGSAPDKIEACSQAIRSYEVVYISGQIPLVPETMELISNEFTDQIDQTFKNLFAVIEAADGTFDNIVKLTIYMTDLSYFSDVNKIILTLFDEPYPARVVIGVNELPKGAQIQVEAILIID